MFVFVINPLKIRILAFPFISPVSGSRNTLCTSTFLLRKLGFAKSVPLAIRGPLISSDSIDIVYSSPVELLVKASSKVSIVMF